MEILRTEKPLKVCFTPLCMLNHSDLKVCYLNSRSLHIKHIEDVRKDVNYSSTDILVFMPRSHGTGSVFHHINLTSFKTSMTLKFVIILQNLIKTYHRKSGKSKCDRKVTELNVEITRIRSRVNGILVKHDLAL